ncbi:hypothetical protein LCGC14_0643610 [marine sediment metagenome]|uniref:Uncharacterized protein n=1 Tax=marine sediment metagenome TaxID=412755 RepID=A0A0F9QYM6_9ZZZZ
MAKNMPRKRRCKTCKFWEEFEPESLFGLCRRYPPSLRPRDKDEGCESDWQSISVYYDWCGEYANR